MFYCIVFKPFYGTCYSQLKQRMKAVILYYFKCEKINNLAVSFCRSNFRHIFVD